MALDVSGSDSLFWRTSINNAGLLAGSTQAKGILRGLAGSISKMDVFAGLAIGSALVFAKISKQAYNFSKEFETAMKEVQTISKAVQNDFKGISQEIIDMSKTVPDNAQKLTKALYQIVSAGYDGAKAMEILRTSTELAVATVTDTFTAADALTYVMNAYGEAAGTAAEISDKLFTIIKLGKVKMEELGPTISMVTGLAAQAGLSFNELAAMYAEAVKKMSPHIVSTGIRGIITAMLRVSKGTGEAADKARELGIEFDISALKSKGFKQILSDIIEKTKGNEAALMSLFPNVRGLIGLLAVMTDEGEGFNKTLTEIENSLGNTGKAFKTMMDTTENQLAILHNNIMAKLKPLGDEILGIMNEVASGINIAMSGANDSLSNMSRAYSELTDTLRRKQSRIDDLIVKIEDLRSKTKEGKDITIELEAAERALMILLPNLGKAAREAGADFDILTAAKEETAEATLRIMKIELTLAEIEEKQAAIALTRFERSEDEANKEVKRLKEKVATWYEEISNRQTAPIRELFRTMSMYSLDNYTKQIDALIKVYDGAGISVVNFGERIRDIQKDMKLGEDTTKRQAKLIKEVTDALFAKDTNLEETMLALSSAELKVGKTEIQLRLDVEKTTEAVRIQREEIKKLEEALLQGKPIVIPDKDKGPDKDTTTTTTVAVNVEEVEAQLKYMASQHKRYLNDVAQFGREYVEEHNTQLIKDGENYAEYLDNMLEMYAENADLTKEIMDDIYEYNKGIIAKKKEAEEEFFNYLAELREKDLKTEKDNFEAIIKNYKEGSTEYLLAVEKHKEKEKAINLNYDKEIADAKFVIFKAGLKQQIGEIDEVYKERYEKQLIAAKAEIGKETEINKIFFKFIHDELNKIAKAKEEQSKIDEAMLASYLDNYRTTEEKITAIHEETNKLIELTDDEATINRLENIEEQKIAEIEAADAMERLNEELARYEKDLDNKGLENYINILNQMKIKYAKFKDIIILLNKEIADSQKELWDNTINEINDTANALHALADVVGNFDTELESYINNIANLATGVAEILSGFATGGLGGIAGILSGLASVLPSILSLFVKVHSEVSAILDDLYDINYALQTQQYALTAATPEETPGAIQDRIALLKEQIAVYQDLIAAEEAAISSFLWWEWSTTDQEKIDQWKLDILEAQQLINNLEEDYIAAQEALIPEVTPSIVQQVQEVMKEVAGITQETIADAIAEGFGEGLDSAALFANTFNDMMRNAIIDAFKETIITQYLKDWMGQFELLSGGGLTTGEIASLAATYQTAILAAGEQWEAIQALMEASGIKLEEIQNTGLTGAIAGITEETAGLLAGQFQAIRINTVEVLSHMENIIIINSKIADNTEYNKYLESIDKKMGEGNTLESEYLRSIGGV